jgi:hypothetical protein
VVSVAQYSGDPGAPATGFSISNGAYFDVSLSSGNTFSQVSIQDCNLSGGTTALWYNGSTWAPVTPASAVTTSGGCLTITLDSSTSPSLSQLTGTPFAAGTACDKPGNGNGDKNHVHCGAPGHNK